MDGLDRYLELPARGYPDHASIVQPVPPGTCVEGARLEGPGCIRHLKLVINHPGSMARVSRVMILRVFVDGEDWPRIEAPVGDFFGVMHGEGWYAIDNHAFSVHPWCGYHCFLPMPFAREWRIEFEAGEQQGKTYLEIEWQRYRPGTTLTPMRLCARWRRESPTERYAGMYKVLDTQGRGRLIGLTYGVRLMDQEDRWSHGGAENIYLDGRGEMPIHLRGVGGEDFFGLGYGGNQTVPRGHHYGGMPYYTHEDVGEARPAPRVVGTRIFEHDPIDFDESLHFRFGCMRNDICSTAYWYQDELPTGWARTTFEAMGKGHRYLTEADADPVRMGAPGPAPDCGAWLLCGPFGYDEGKAMREALPPEAEFDVDAVYDGRHEEGSRWLTDGSKSLGRDRARWVKYDAIRGFVDFNHVFQPYARGVGIWHPGVAYARAIVHAPEAMTARAFFSFDDELAYSLNDAAMAHLGDHACFRPCAADLPLKAGENVLLLKQSNTRGLNHGGWVFNCQIRTPAGELLAPRAG